MSWKIWHESLKSHGNLGQERQHKPWLKKQNQAPISDAEIFLSFLCITNISVQCIYIKGLTAEPGLEGVAPGKGVIT